jgi:hypothetical protein
MDKSFELMEKGMSRAAGYRDVTNELLDIGM